MEIKRYSLDDRWGVLVEDPEGGLVKYEDIQHLIPLPSLIPDYQAEVTAEMERAKERQ